MINKDLSQTKNFEISILIPTLNEQTSITKILEEINLIIAKDKLNACIVISDNGSSDATINKINNFEVFLNEEKIKGYGSNLRSGLSKIKSKYVIFFDADGSYNPEEIPKYLKTIKDHDLEMVSGNRLKKMQSGAMPLLNRYLGTPVLSFLIRFFYKLPIKDCNSGMKIIKTEKLDKLDLKCDGMEFASELVVKAGLQKLKFKEINIYFRRDYRNSPPHLNRWVDGWRHLKFILTNINEKYFYNFFGIYIILMLSSLVLSSQKFNGEYYKYHTVLSLSSMALIWIFFTISLLISRSNIKVNCKLIKKIKSMQNSNEFIKCFYFAIILFLIDFLILFIRWALSGFIELDNFFTIIRLMTYSQIAVIALMLDLSFDHKS